ncbi:phosphatidate phosphatase APP1 [Friedmanniella endophytica]|uniref:Phosphatidate phosphatase APP1 n=1 Tax=Microlunatus kandeliicorticis TaxID=1759536 RepID=A0A7W3IQ33_9ACTN|nr:phosphatase domain-containing protein [Microlunatus kandeliicorticis]MBA8793176.1 phosphatidate phosphatase APP1 [Microlunatus kandeliicorticis]
MVTPERTDDRHRAARIDDAILRFRERRARRRRASLTVLGYTGYGSTSWVRVLARVLLTQEPSVLAQSTAARRLLSGPGVRGWRSFTSVPVVNADVRIDAEGEVHHVRADRGGVVDVRIPVSLSPGWHTLRLTSEDSAPAEADIFVVGDDVEFGVVSDIDDTVMVTALPRPLLAAWHTFVVNEHARTATPGMAVLYEWLSSEHAGSPVIYLSTGAWNVAPTLTRFLSRNLYPAGPLLLTDWGPTRDRWFRSGTEHKRGNLARLAEEFPRIKWLLIGDDGQHDEEIYGEFLAQHPDHVAAVAIRQLSPGEAVLAGGRGRHVRPEYTDRWFYGPDGAALAPALEKHGLLPHRMNEDPFPG